VISTQTASSSASLQWTNLPTSYNTLFLNCSGLLTSVTSTYIYLYVGEGAGPTWKTSANYTDAGVYGGSGAQEYHTTTATEIFDGAPFHTTRPSSIKLYVDSVASSSIYKMFSFDINQVSFAGSTL
jgi:hypothetical protein